MTAGILMPETDGNPAGKITRNAEAPEQRIFRQLLEAFVFEQIIPFETLDFGTTNQADGFSIVRMNIAGKDVCLEARIGAFDRFEIRKHSAMDVESGMLLGLEAAFMLVDSTDAGPEKRAALKEELKHTARLCNWNLSHLRTDEWDRRSLGYEELDSRIHEGHPYHPCFKARTGFSEDDHRHYGPEAGLIFELAWLAVRRDHLQLELPCEEHLFWVSEIGEETLLELIQRLETKGVSLGTHGLLPVHPWQWQAIESRYQNETGDGIILSLGTSGDGYRATQSLRTLMNHADPQKAHLKLPMTLVNTSSLRTFDAPLVRTAPHVSEWLSRVVTSDRFFLNSAPLVILKEYAAALYQPLCTEVASVTLPGELGCIWRQSVRSVLGPGESAIPFNALCVMEGDCEPFFAPWIIRFGLERWLWRLLEATISPVWRLFADHGIAIEAHAQNLVLIHQDGWPLRIAARDFHESTEYTEKFLTGTACFLPDFTTIAPDVGNAPPDQFHKMASVESLRELFMDTVFIYNLVELERVLRSEYGFSEATFWAIAGKFMTTYPGSGARSQRVEAIGHRAPRLRTESLMRKKLFGDRATEFHHEVSNPFHIP